MTAYLEIKSIHACEILDSRRNPTVEAEVTARSHENKKCYTETDVGREQ